MYARGTREIVGYLRDLYGIDVSPDLISAVTDAVLDEVAAWQARPLEATYPQVRCLAGKPPRCDTKPRR
jgi:putative transposase